MDNRIRGLLGLTDGGKRVYQIKDGEIDADEFEYCQVLSQVLFGPKGLVETLGPTWEMVHDPRFEKIEALFVIHREGKFGGDAREGVQVQQKDGTFTNSFSGLQQYSEMLGEGRFLIGVLQSFSIIEALDALFPNRKLRVDGNDPLGALKVLGEYPKDVKDDLHRLAKQAMHTLPLEQTSAVFNAWISFDGDSGPDLSNIGLLTVAQQWALAELVDPNFFFRSGYLSPVEQTLVRTQAATYKQYLPHSVPEWKDDRIWGLIRLEYPNYFTRKGVPNREAKTLFTIVKAGLLGLVSDYAEVANVQETVLLDDPNTLYEPATHGEDAPRVAMEIENLERALSYRGELRVTAGRIIDSLGIASQMVDLTDYERDQMLKIVYQSQWPIEKTAMIMSLLQYTNSIRLSGLSVEERRFKQLNEASASAKRYVEGLKDGTITPITRESDGVVETSVEDSEKLLERNIGHPLFAHILLRYTDLEKRFFEAKAEFLSPYTSHSVPDLVRLFTHPTDVLIDLYEENPTFKAYENLVCNFVTGADELITLPLSDGQMSQLHEMRRLLQAIDVLTPGITQLDYELTEQGAFDLLHKVEKIDPTPVKPTAEYEGTLEESSRVQELPATVH